MGALDSVFGAQGLPSSPTSQSIQTSGIAPWAQPFVSDYLTRALELSKQGPSAAQQQVYNAAQNMQTPGQFGSATDLAQQGGQGSLSTSPMALNYGQIGSGYGQMGAGIGAQGIGVGAQGQQYGMNAGAEYARQATNPYAVAAYMNPFIQQALAPQMELLNQQQQLGSQNIAAKAVGQGAFGGNRATLAQGLNAQNYALAKQQAMGQAYTDAFKQAQQAQQFGSQLGLQGAMQGTQLGLQGLGTALQGAGLGIQGAQAGLQGVSGAQQGYQGATQAGAALGNIGAQQGQYNLGQLALQNQIANQQYNLPYQNLQFMQGMMSGLPVSTSTTQGYQAPPNYLSQAAGLGFTGLGIYGMGKDMGWWGKGGSQPSVGSGGLDYGMSSGGGDYSFGTDALNASGSDLSTFYGNKGGQIKRYATGGDIKLKKNDQLQALLSNPNVTPMEKDAIMGQLMLNSRVESNPESRQIMSGGLDMIPSGDMFRAAGGGIVAFAGETDGSLVKGKKIPPNVANYESWLEDTIRKKMEALETGNPFEKSQELERQYAESMKERQARRPYETLIGLGAGIMSGDSPYALSNIGKGGIFALQQQQRMAAEDAADRKLLLQQAVEQEKAKYGRDTGNLNTLLTSQGQLFSKQIAKMNAGAAGSSANFWRAQNVYNAAVKDARDTLIDQAKKPGSEAYKKYRNDANALERDAIANARAQVGQGVLDTLGLSGSKGTYTPTIGGGAGTPTLPPGFELNK